MSDFLLPADRNRPDDALSEQAEPKVWSGTAPAGTATIAGGPTGPSVTVVVAAYNAEKFIQETLESVAAQSLENIEIIVVDDGSTDGTPDLLRAFADRRLIVLRQDNRGVSAARNAGLALARAPYIFFLDADDILLRDALLRMVATLDRMPRRVACFAHHTRIAEDGSALSTRDDLRWKLFPVSDTLRHLIAKNFIVCGAICIRTDAARAVHGFNPALKLGEDWEFWCRLAVLGDFAAMPDHIALKYRQRFVSANYRLRKSPLRQNFEAIDAVFSNPAIQKKFPAADLKRRRRLAEIDAFWAGARNEYVRDRTISFLRHLIVGAVCYPDSILRPRLVYLFLRGLVQHLSRPLPMRTGS
jgi:glycosyltransferase involved in cell wall biosynthesis